MLHSAEQTVSWHNKIIAADTIIFSIIPREMKFSYLTNAPVLICFIADNSLHWLSRKDASSEFNWLFLIRQLFHYLDVWKGPWGSQFDQYMVLSELLMGSFSEMWRPVYFQQLSAPALKEWFVKFQKTGPESVIVCPFSYQQCKPLNGQVTFPSLSTLPMCAVKSFYKCCSFGWSTLRKLIQKLITLT